MKSWVTWVLIGANVAMFAVELAAGADPVQPVARDVLHLGGNFAPYTIGHHEWWRVLSSMFLHFGVLHIFMNMLCLWQARAVEQMYGHGGFATIYFVSGILGGVGSMARNGLVVSAGASGAVFGVFGAFAAHLLRVRKTAEPAAWHAVAQRLGTFIAINMIIGLQAKGIDVTAHFVGLVVGFACGLVVPKLKAVPTLAIGLALAVGGLVLTPATLADPFVLDDLLHDFGEVEHQAVTKYNDAIRAHKANQIDRAQLADTIEHDVIAPWHAMRLDVEAIPDGKIPPRAKPLFAILRQYCKDRERAWTEAMLINREQPQPSYRDDETQADQDAQQLSAEINRLKTQ